MRSGSNPTSITAASRVSSQHTRKAFVANGPSTKLVWTSATSASLVAELAQQLAALRARRIVLDAARRPAIHHAQNRPSLLALADDHLHRIRGGAEDVAHLGALL